MGPLAGIKVLEFEAIGPAPFCGMMLADMGADVLLLERPVDPQLGLERERWYDVMLRGRRSVTLDMKAPDSVAAALDLVRKADVVLEGFRPGVMERLGLGPDVMLAANPKLVVGRMTGWGQDGPLAPRAGHDINYIAMSGVLHAIGRAGGAPCSAAQPGGRLWRRRHAAGVRRRLRHCRSAALGPRAGGRRRHGGRRFAVVDDVLGHAGRRPVERHARREHPRYRRAVVRRLRDAGPQVRRRRRHRVQVLRGVAGANGTRGGGAAVAARPSTVAGIAAAFRAGIRREDARRMVRQSSPGRMRAFRRC